MKKLLLIVGLVFSLVNLWAVTIVPGSSFPVTNVPPDWARILMVDTNGNASADPNTKSNLTLRYDQLMRNVATNAQGLINSYSNLSASSVIGFTYLITNGSSTATIQATLNSMTNGGVVSVQPGVAYDITAPIIITNSMLIEGNLARFKYHLGTTNFMVDTRTNFGKPIVIQDLVFDGGVPAPYLSGTYAPGLGGNNNPYLNQFWTNSSGLRIECSGGAVIRGCYFTGWPGNGLMLLNKFNSLSQSYPRAFVINNTFATNFIGCYLPSHDYEIPGYYNSDSSLWNFLQPEYSQIIDNQFWGNQIAVVPDAGNTTVTGNIINSNYIGTFFQPGANEGHGNYSVNNLNHNIIPIYWQGGPGNAGTFDNNLIYQCQKIVFSSALNIQFKNNILQSTSLIFTNGCQGEISGNTYGQGAGDRWGIDISTNFTGSPNLRIFNNIGSIGTNHDGSVPSIAAFTTNSPTAGYFWSTTDLVHGQWVPGPVSTTNFSGINVTNTASITAGTFGGVQVTNLLNVLTGGALTAYQAGIGFLTVSNQFGITYLKPASSLTNVLLLLDDGSATTSKWPPNVSGGSSFPLTANTDAGGQYQLTNNSSISTTNFHVARYDPFVTSTRMVFDGNSRVSGFGNAWPHWPGILYSNLLSQEHLVGYVNLGVSGRTVEQNAADYSTGGHVYRPATGTNAWYFWMDSINDSINSSNVQTTINAMSNILTTAKSDGYTVVACTAFEASAMTQAQLGLLAQENDYLLTNTISDYVLDVHSWMNYGKLSSDGTHFSQGGDTNTAQQMYTVITSSRGNRFTSTHELRATDLLEVYSQGDIYNVRGRPTLMRLSSDIPAMIFDAGGAGGAFFGLYQGELNLWITNNGQNIPALNSFSIGSSRAAFMQPVHAQAGVNTPFITVTNTAYIPTNTAPGVVIASALLHTLDIGKGFTNDMNCKVTAVLELFLNESAVNGTSFAFQNTNTGASHYGFTNADPANILATYRRIYYFQHIGPGDVGSLFDTSGAGASVTKSQSFWITE